MSIEHETKHTSKFQWILFAIVIPIIFAITIGLIISNIAGVNVFQKVQEIGGEIPFISSTTDDEEEENELAHYEATIKDRDAELEDLETQLQNRDEDLKKLEAQIQDYEKQIEELKDKQVIQEEEIKKLTNSFKGMDSKRAAEIIVEMNETNAIQLLSNLPDEVRGSILSEMEPEDAATFTNTLIDQ